MILDFENMEETVLEHFNGGEKELFAKMHVDEKNRILKGRLKPGASVGEHTHETSSEIIYFLKGNGKVICDGKEERVKAGVSHYCPKDHTHTLINDSNDELCFFAVVPEQ